MPKHLQVRSNYAEWRVSVLDTKDNIDKFPNKIHPITTNDVRQKQQKLNDKEIQSIVLDLSNHKLSISDISKEHRC